MAIITDGVITIGRAAANYANKMAAEQDAWTMIQNIASNFFASLNEALREKGYTPAGAALWGACVITVSIGAAYGAYKIYRWKYPAAVNNPNPNPQSPTPAKKAFDELAKYYNNNKTNLDLNDLNTRFIALTSITSYDKEFTSADKALFDDIKNQIETLTAAANQKALDAKRDNALTSLNNALAGNDQTAIKTAEGELQSAWSNATLSTEAQGALNKVAGRIEELELDQYRKDLEDATEYDALVSALNAYLRAPGELSAAADKGLVDEKTDKLEKLVEEEAKKITDTDVDDDGKTYQKVEDLDKADIEVILGKLKTARDLSFVNFDVAPAIAACENELIVIKHVEKVKELDEELAKDALDRNPDTLQSLYDEELALKTQLNEDEDTGRKDEVNDAIKKTLEAQLTKLMSVSPTDWNRTEISAKYCSLKDKFGEDQITKKIKDNYTVILNSTPA